VLNLKACEYDVFPLRGTFVLIWSSSTVDDGSRYLRKQNHTIMTSNIIETNDGSGDLWKAESLNYIV
jgi:hypothetical protein